MPKSIPLHIRIPPIHSATYYFQDVFLCCIMQSGKPVSGVLRPSAAPCPAGAQQRTTHLLLWRCLAAPAVIQLLPLEPPLQRGLWLIPSFILQQSALRYCFKHFSHLTHLFVCLFLIQLLMLEYRFCDSRNILSSLRVYILNRDDIIPRGQNYLTFEESIISLFLCI